MLYTFLPSLLLSFGLVGLLFVALLHFTPLPFSLLPPRLSFLSHCLVVSPSCGILYTYLSIIILLPCGGENLGRSHVRPASRHGNDLHAGISPSLLNLSYLCNDLVNEYLRCHFCYATLLLCRAGTGGRLEYGIPAVYSTTHW